MRYSPHCRRWITSKAGLAVTGPSALGAVSASESARALSGPGGSGQVRSGQVRFITRPKSRTMRAKRNKTFESQQNECAQMSNELESLSDSVMVMNLESFGVDGDGYDETETEPPSSSSTNPQ